jgi:3-phytase
MQTRATLLLTIFSFTCAAAPAQTVPAPAGSVRFATFNASLNRTEAGGLVRHLSSRDNTQARNVAEVVQRVRPDVLLINEFDFDPDGGAARRFQENYLAVSQSGAPPIDYPHRFTSEVNTGVASGLDLDKDGAAVTTPGSRGYGNDALGFGQFPGQYGMVLYSKFPIDRGHVRDFRKLLWKDMPGALLPRKADGSPWYSPEALAVLRLSSKAHWDIPLAVGSKTIHVLASHPTPPAFDGPEGRNVKRNHDEIRLWADYLTGGDRAEYLRTALPPGASIAPPGSFVILGDMNADPADGGGVPGAIQQLLKHSRVNADPPPRNAGGKAAADAQGGANRDQRGDPALDTADFADERVGNLRVDYVLPSRDLALLGGGVFWPADGDPLARLVRMAPEVATSDHRLVYVDVRQP